MNLHYQCLPSNSVVCLLSPTASGKTDLAFKLYATGRFEIISVDSALIYQGMDIGSAKPSRQQLLDYPHHLVDIIKPNDSYSMMNFIADCKCLIEQIHNNNKIPLLVGGTMMYYAALLDGISPIPASDKAARTHVAEVLANEGNAGVYAYLLAHDPVICQRLVVNDTQRITRAMEVHYQTGIALSQWQQIPKVALAHNPDKTWYALTVTPDRAWLHARIEQRLNQMWQAGLVAEVVSLIDNYALHPDMPALRCVGYRQVIDDLLAGGQLALIDGYLQKTGEKIDADPCQGTKNKALYATRQLAKRQYTWLRQLSNIESPTITGASPKIARFLSIEQLEKHLL